MASGSVSVYMQAAAAYVYVVIWMSISMAVIMFNKWLLAYSGFPYPIALTLWCAPAARTAPRTRMSGGGTQRVCL